MHLLWCIIVVFCHKLLAISFISLNDTRRRSSIHFFKLYYSSWTNPAHIPVAIDKKRFKIQKRKKSGHRFGCKPNQVINCPLAVLFIHVQKYKLMVWVFNVFIIERAPRQKRLWILFFITSGRVLSKWPS